jgi:hypothetical protein
MPDAGVADAGVADVDAVGDGGLHATTAADATTSAIVANLRTAPTLPASRTDDAVAVRSRKCDKTGGSGLTGARSRRTVRLP